ncbi:hypothetical protein BpHYR1_044706, partial [Brachionus plicatilis]
MSKSASVKFSIGKSPSSESLASLNENSTMKPDGSSESLKNGTPQSNQSPNSILTSRRSSHKLFDPNELS